MLRVSLAAGALAPGRARGHGDAALIVISGAWVATRQRQIPANAPGVHGSIESLLFVDDRGNAASTVHSGRLLGLSQSIAIAEGGGASNGRLSLCVNRDFLLSCGTPRVWRVEMTG